jgi:hypothetical protein
MALHFTSLQVTLVIRAFAFRLFAYPRFFYFSIMRSVNTLSSVTVEAAAQGHWVARAVSLTRPTILTPGLQIKASHGVSLRKYAAFIRFPFYAFSIYAAIRKNANPAYNESHLCISYQRSVHINSVTNETKILLIWHFFYKRNRREQISVGLKIITVDLHSGQVSHC